MLPPLLVNVTCTIVETLFYGLYLATLFLSLRRLLYARGDWKPFQLIHRKTLMVTLMIFVASTLDLALSIRRSLLSVLGTPPSRFLWSNILMSALVHTQALMADAILMYRCWIVFAKSKFVLIFPAALWFASFACAIARAYWQPTERSHTKLVKTIIEVFWSCSITLNIYATSLIAYRITSIAKVNNRPTRRVRFVMRVIIESGMLYTATAVMVLLACIPSDNAARLISSAINFQVVGIALNLIIIRKSPDATEEETMAAESLTTVRLTTVGDITQKT